MTASSVTRLTARVDRAHARVERHLRRYPAAVQTAVRAAARLHPHVADLAVSFPALLPALATARRAGDRERLVAAILAGEPLAIVAAGAGIPFWLRKLPPEAFAGPVPLLPDDPLFRRQIANHLPDAKLAPLWLDAVARAARWGHEGLAVWIAREIMRDRKRAKRLNCLNAISLWAWYAAHVPPETSFITRRWHPAMNFETAFGCADGWLTRVALHLNIGTDKFADMWLQPGTFGGYAFVPLDCAQAVAEEAAAMNNCMCNYGYDLAHDRSRLWSMRRNGARVANVSVVRWGDDPLPAIGELQLASNRDAPAELWLIAREWLNSHDLRGIDTQRPERETLPLDPTRWRLFWRPYWLAKRCLPAWLPLMASRHALRAL
jgi:hypothetical protein